MMTSLDQRILDTVKSLKGPTITGEFVVTYQMKDNLSDECCTWMTTRTPVLGDQWMTVAGFIEMQEVLEYERGRSVRLEITSAD